MRHVFYFSYTESYAEGKNDFLATFLEILRCYSTDVTGNVWSPMHRYNMSHKHNSHLKKYLSY